MSHDNCHSYFKCLVLGPIILKKAPAFRQQPWYTRKQCLLLKFVSHLHLSVPNKMMETKDKGLVCKQVVPRNPFWPSVCS